MSGGRLSEGPIEEIRSLIYAPSIAGAGDADFRDMCALNQAHLVMLAETGILAPEMAQEIAAALRKIAAEGRTALPTDPDLEDPYLAFEARLAEIAGADLAGRIHIARSRNDIGATLHRMQARRHWLAITAALDEARAALLDKAEAHLETIVPGYTHLQPAQPITFGYQMVSLATALERDAARFNDAYARIDACSLGAAALGGSSFAIDRELTAGLLGFSRVATSCLDAVASRDFAMELLFAATTLSITWSRAVQDLYVGFTDEFGAIMLPDRIAGTSSIMPQKKNPIALEYLRAEAARTIGALTSTLAAARGTNFSISLDAIREGLDDLWLALSRVPGDLALFARIVESAAPRVELLEKRCSANFSTATDLADGLVRDAGLPFRQAHHVVGAVVRAALAQGLGANEIDAAFVERIAEPILGHKLGIDDSFVRACLDPRQAVMARRTVGGTAPSEVARMVTEARLVLARDVAARAERASRLDGAAEALAARLQLLADPSSVAAPSRRAGRP
jgi:argininosuccinate lyase